MELKEYIKLKDDLMLEIDVLFHRLQIQKKREKIAEIDQELTQPNFWDDRVSAEKSISELKCLKDIVDSWTEIFTRLEDLVVLEEMMNAESDTLNPELIVELQAISEVFADFEQQLLLSAEHDFANAYVELHSGEGGVDAQDFTQILMRLYSRWSDKHNFECQVLSLQQGDEAGIKSATLHIIGPFAYGNLKSEHGVHRLIRLSPFDTAKRRHTSFASITVIPEIVEDINFEINDNDLKIDTYRSSGAGGQSVNTTDSAVRITHLPTGTVVTCQNERSQIQNREQAMKILYAKLYELAEQKKQEAADKINNQKMNIGFGSQIRSYVFHPYNMVKDHRTNYEVGNVADVINGNIDGFIEAYLKYLSKEEHTKGITND